MKYAGLISGGVDSAVAVYLMKEQGITPDLFYIKIGSGEEGQWDCSAEEDWEMASAVAKKYGCHLELIDLQKEYWEHVVGYIIDRLKKGLTPNSDVMCNKYIKFGAFEERAGHLYDKIATGHYASTEIDSQGRVWLTTSPDAVKDQTDFLAQLDTIGIQKIMLPIGQLTKDEVRDIAIAQHLAPAKRHDSQGICFLGKIKFAELAKRYLGEKEGLVVEKETGNIIGKHQGYWFFTIGQRKGLGFGGGPWYVVDKDIRRNIIYVSHGYQTAAAYGRHFLIEDPHFITMNPFEKEGTYDVTFKVRHTPEFTHGKLTVLNGKFSIESSLDVQGIAPGQFAVLYDKEGHRCYGSGEIRK